MTIFRCMTCGVEDAGCELEIGKIGSPIPSHCPFDGTTICEWIKVEE